MQSSKDNKDITIQNYTDSITYCDPQIEKLTEKTEVSSQNNHSIFYQSFFVQPFLNKKETHCKSKTLPTLTFNKTHSSFSGIKPQDSKKNLVLISNSTKLKILKKTKKQKKKKKKFNANKFFSQSTLSAIYKVENKFYLSKGLFDKKLYNPSNSNNQNTRNFLTEHPKAIEKELKTETNITKIKDKDDGQAYVKQQLYKLIENAKNFGNDEGAYKKSKNYIYQMKTDLLKSIKQSEFKVRDTMDYLRRLQHDNDENLNRISFVNKIAK